MKRIGYALKILFLVSMNVFILGVGITFIWGKYDPSGRVVEGPAWLEYPMQYSLWGMGISVSLLCLYGINKSLIEEMFKPSPPPHENEVLPNNE